MIYYYVDCGEGSKDSKEFKCPMKAVKHAKKVGTKNVKKWWNEDKDKAHKSEKEKKAFKLLFK